MPVRLVIVDDHPLIRRGFSRTSQDHADLEMAGEAECAAEALLLVRSVVPDVVVIDSVLPDGSGVKLAARLRAEFPGMGLVLLDSGDDDSLMLAAIEAGASAVVAKTAPVEQAIAAARHAAAAPSAFSAVGLAAALARSRSDTRLLSPRELDVLVGLRDGLSIPAIARAIHVSESTAKTYVARLYEKLGAGNRTQALLAALRLGLIRNEGLPRAGARVAVAATPSAR
jgi:DNA-binding NarL/FixJ family response regulator